MRGVGQRIELPGGRQLGYDDYGPPDGAPVLLFHGTPSSRLGWAIFGSAALAGRLGIRIVAPDRPGLGLSDEQPGRRIADWPADVVALADALAIDRFAVLGYSGGGPYAIACAWRIPERLTAVGIAGGTGPYDMPGAIDDVDPAILFLLTAARDRPRVARSVFELLATLARRAPRTLIAQAMAALPGPDRATLALPEVQRAVVAAFLEAVHQGARGVQVDMALMAGPWGFDPHEIARPVRIWHGEEDHFVSPAMVRRLAESLAGAQATFFPNEGHVSLLAHYGEEVLDELIMAAQ